MRSNKEKVNNRRRDKWKTSHYIIFIFLMIYVVIIIYPLIWMVISSMKEYSEIYENVWGLPSKWLFSNYAEAWDKGIANYFVNSLIVTGSTIVLVVIISSLAAYGLSRYKTKAVDIMLLLVMLGMMVNPQVCLIPLYQLLRGLKLHDTRLALILCYTAFRLPISILLLRSYFLTIPKEIEESARMDGCGDFGIYSRIFLPMSRPIISTVVVLTSYYAWNEFLFSIIFIDSSKLKTIPAGLMNFRDALQTDWGVLLAGMVIATIPMIILLIVLQKQLVRGLSEGAVKG